MYLLSLLTTLLFASPAPLHDYHVSKTNVRYVAEKSQVQVEMHLFVEDLELDMQAAGTPVLQLGTKKQLADAERYLLAYLEKHFRIRWNGEDLDLQLLGFELDDDLHGFWIYLVSPVDAEPVEVEIANSLLTGTFADQKNIVKLFRGDERTATLLMSKDRPTAYWAGE